MFNFCLYFSIPIYIYLLYIQVPSLQPDHIISSLFPEIDRSILLGIPVAIGTIFFLAIVIFSIVQMKAYKPKTN